MSVSEHLHFDHLDGTDVWEFVNGRVRFSLTLVDRDLTLTFAERGARDSYEYTTDLAPQALADLAVTLVRYMAWRSPDALSALPDLSRSPAPLRDTGDW